MDDTDLLNRVRGALAGRYAVERELGHGGMGSVYLARDLKHDREVALKVLRPDIAATLGAERFLREIRITAHLDHPHILTLIDSGASNGLLWYVLPYVRGESLRDRLIREQQLPIVEALAITRQVAGALEHAHRQGVIHRDVKPENILLHESEAVVADFGIALALREAGGERLTASGLAVGTPQYMSPEQAAGDRHVDARTDVYALGAVLYEMLAGEPPFTGLSPQRVIAKILTERPAPLRTVRETVPQAVDEAVARALARVPADRFRSTSAFVQAFETPLMERRRTRWWLPTRRPAKSRRLGVMLVIAAGAVGATVYAYPTLVRRVQIQRPGENPASTPLGPSLDVVDDAIPDSVIHAARALGVIPHEAGIRYVFAPHGQSVGNSLIVTDSQLIRIEPGRTRTYRLRNRPSIGSTQHGSQHSVWLAFTQSPAETLFVSLNRDEARALSRQLEGQLRRVGTLSAETSWMNVLHLPPPALDVTDDLIPDSVVQALLAMDVVANDEKLRYVFAPYGQSIRNSVIVTDSQLIRVEPGRTRMVRWSSVAGIGSADKDGRGSVWVQVARPLVGDHSGLDDLSAAFSDIDTLFGTLSIKERVVLFERLMDQWDRATQNQ